MVVFESEDAAQAMSERVPSMAPEVVRIEDIECARSLRPRSCRLGE